MRVRLVPFQKFDFFINELEYLISLLIEHSFEFIPSCELTFFSENYRNAGLLGKLYPFGYAWNRES